MIFGKRCSLSAGFYSILFLFWTTFIGIFTRHFYWNSNHFISLLAPTMSWFLPQCLVYDIPNSKGIFFFLNTNNFFRWINFSGYVLGWLYGRPWKAPYDCNKSIQGKLEHQSPFENVFIMSLWHLWWTRNEFVPTVSPLNHILRSWKETANR